MAAGLLLTVLVLLTGACSKDSDPPSTSASESPADSEGRALYQRHCASCHGTDLRGTDKGPSHLSQVYEAGHHPDDSFRAAVTQGARAHHWDFGDMAPVPGLSAEEIDAVIAFIRHQQETEGLEPYPPT